MKYLLLILFSASLVFAYQDITSFGAIPHDEGLTAVQTNAKAFRDAIEKAKESSSTGDDRVVFVPDHKFYTLPF